MAFTLYNWSCVSSSLNQGLVSAAISTPSSDTTVLQGSMNLFSYYSLDSVATISGANYFLPVIFQLCVNDVIMVTGSDGSIFLQVATLVYPDDVSSGSVTTLSFTPAGAVGTANITNLAVTTDKIADANVTLAKLAAGIAPSHVVKFAGKDVSAGGSATVVITATGVAASDVVFADIQASANAVNIQKVTPTTNTITVLCSADPGAATISYQALRAAV